MTRPDQRASASFATPPIDAIPAISAGHVAAMEGSDADEAWVILNMHHLILHTVGRRSARPHRVALPYWLDDSGERVVVASFAGSDRHPAWFANISDRDVNPDVLVRVQGGQYRCVPETLDGDERSATWATLVADRPWYGGYQERTSRLIPLVRLPAPAVVA